jgi:AmmeMemoRadiSam system protein B
VSNLDALPRLRYVDAFPVDVEGEQLIYLRDPEGIAGEGLGVPPHVFDLMRLLDGHRTMDELRRKFAEETGGMTVSGDEVTELIQSLDEALLLESDRFRRHRKEVEEAYRAEPRRPSPLAGRSYPEDPDALRTLMEGFFSDPEGPGNTPTAGGVTGLVAPHIDFGRGGPCFAWAYNELRNQPPADVYVVLGTGHTARKPYTLTRKVFETPLGDLASDQRLIDRISGYANQDLFEDEIAHKNEHSIEFQAVFLKYLFPDADISFVPILCGSFYQSVEEGVYPILRPEVEDFVSALRKALEEEDRSVCLIAGVDFSHVGEQFGDSGPMSDAFVDDVRSSDADLLEAAGKRNAEAFFDVIVRDCDRHRVCGTSSIYTMLQVLNASSGKLLKYDQAIDRDADSLVSFASMAFYE